MLNSGCDTDVLIVGAGPVGLFLANECARRGIRFGVIEHRESQSTHSKALAIFPRTLEIFDMAGVVDRFLEKANRVTAVSVITHGRRLAHMRFTPGETPYSFVAMVPQNITESLLLHHLRQAGGDVDYGTRFVTADQREDHVNAIVEQNGERRQISASFLVGCDGAHSAVRHALSVPMEGGEYRDQFILADIETSDSTNEIIPADELQLCPSELGPVAIFPIGPTRRRIVATLEQTEGDAPSLDLVRKVLAERAPAGIEALSLHWSSYFRIHHRNAARLRMGRIFIAGDAAHIHSPFGGQGMNTGLHDVWNLVWKLDLALRGHSSDDLLSSYEAERLPVIQDVIHTTDTLTKVMGTPYKFAQVLRDTFIPMVSRLAPFQHAFVQRLSELGIAYRGSPIVEGPGVRYFDDSIRGGKGIGSRFLLFAGDYDAAVKKFTGFDDVVELRHAGGSGITLVRPDGYVAYHTDHAGSAGLDAARALLEKQVGAKEHAGV
ncbi:MAG TPA: FAD-dependent monooxygenase [Bryobacteraceae bacterium]|nr:FAD-dependent monooxygenase [Bryobacteraceae bacterium]